jgi:general secretion pathway protein G
MVTMRRTRRSAFTLIELIVVLAIVALLLAVAVPRYFNSVERSKEAALKQNLGVTRDAIDKYYGDIGRYPETLDELVSKRYLRKLPEDPVAQSKDTWILVRPPGEGNRTGIYDLKSGAPGNAPDGTPFAEW